LCYAETFADYKRNCKYGRLKNSDWIVVHPYGDNKTKEFSNIINQKNNDTLAIKAFIVIDQDLTLDAGFDSGI